MNADKNNTFYSQRPYADLYPAEYEPYAPLFSQLKEELDQYLEKLLEGELDDANGDVLDSIITDYMRQAINDLSYQRVKHRQTIHELVIVPEALRRSFEENQPILESEMSELKSELQDIQSRIKHRKWRD